MGVSTSEVGYDSATTGRGDHEVHKEHMVALEKRKEKITSIHCIKHYLKHAHHGPKFHNMHIKSLKAYTHA
jgi:hypothetical protein